MGRIADRIGVRWTVAFGAVMIGVGLAVSTGDSAWRLWVGHGLFIGLLGNGGINAPLYVYVSRWFDRRRGTALALISSGQYVAGAVWPSVFERGIASIGWRHTMTSFAIVEALAVVPLAVLILREPPEASRHAASMSGKSVSPRVLGMPANIALAILSVAAFTCCVPMAMPQAHLVAFCTDLGITASHGAAMLSVLLGCAFVSRQFWGWISDRIGGLRTVLAGSLCQIVAMVGFAHPERARPVRCSNFLRSGIQRCNPGLRACHPRALSRRRRSLEGADLVALQRFRDGGGRLARRRDLRRVWILRRRLRHRDRIQPGQPHSRRFAGVSSAPGAASGAGWPRFRLISR